MSIILNILEAVKAFFLYFKLKNKVEIILFLFFFIFIFIVQYKHYAHLVNNTSILGYDAFLIKWLQVPSKAFVTIKHPFITLFILLLTGVMNILKLFMNPQSALYIIYIFYHLSVIYSVIFIYRILSEVIGINQFRSIMLTVLFSSLAYIMIQAFIIESYPLSLLLLTLTLYIAGREICLQDKSSPYLYGLLFILTAGVTITNGAKTIMAYLFTERKRGMNIKWIVAVCLLMAIIYIPTKLVTSKVNQTELLSERVENINDIPNQSLNKEIETVTGHQVRWLKFIRFDVAIFPSIRTNILGESALFHNSDFKKEIRNGRDIYLDYASPADGWIIALFYIFTAFSIIISFKQKFSKALLAFLSVDIFIHLICRFGIEEPYIFGPHWLFLIPLFLAFLYKSEQLKKAYYFFDGLIILFTVFFLYNNWSVIFKFLDSLNT